MSPSGFSFEESATAPLPKAPAPEVGELRVTVYTPESPLRHPGRLAGEMIGDLLASRELAWRLFIRDISALYRQSILGYVWAFLPPLVTTLTFIYLNSQNIVSSGETRIPYPAYVMIGTLLWQVFLDALNSPLKAVTSSRSMLAKINFPREALILSGLGEVLFNFLVRAVLLVPVFLYYQIPMGLSLLWMPVGIAALMLLGLAFGMLFAPVGILYNDIGRGVLLLGGFWMLLTPVVYQTPKTGLGATLAGLNPVAPVLQTCRDWLTGQPPLHFEGLACVSAGALVCLLFGWVLYRLSMPILIERMGG